MNKPRASRVAVTLAWLVGLLFAGLSLAAEPAAATPTDDELLFRQLINQLRSDRGLDHLSTDLELTIEARAWTTVMATNDQLAHSPDITSGVTSPWTVLGENVGRHGIHDIQQLFDAFVASPTHLENLVDPRYQYIGIAVVHQPDGTIWTTHRFMAIEPVSAAPPSPEDEAPGGEPSTVAVPSSAAEPEDEPPLDPSSASLPWPEPIGGHAMADYLGPDSGTAPTQMDGWG